LSEYREVLLRPKFGFSSDAVEALLDQIMASGDSVSAGSIHRPLPDPDDEPFLEVAISGMADALVTGNKRHYPKPARAGIRVLSPREFLEYYKMKDG
jgi:predicted nucleic acid-binding protein